MCRAMMRRREELTMPFLQLASAVALPVSVGQKDRWSERSDEKIAFLRTGLGVSQVSVFSGICSTWTLRRLRTQIRIAQRSRGI